MFCGYTTTEVGVQPTTSVQWGEKDLQSNSYRLHRTTHGAGSRVCLGVKHETLNSHGIHDSCIVEHLNYDTELENTSWTGEIKQKYCLGCFLQRCPLKENHQNTVPTVKYGGGSVEVWLLLCCLGTWTARYCGGKEFLEEDTMYVDREPFKSC